MTRGSAGVTVGALIDARPESAGLPLALLAGASGLGRLITSPYIQKTGLALAGFDHYLNSGRLLAAPVLIWLSGWMKSALDLRLAISLLASFFLLGVFFLVFLPETKGRELPEA